MDKIIRKITIRERLLDIIVEHSGDEFETIKDALVLAKENDHELLDRVESILEYYNDNAQS
jgi:hypothetical protein